MRRVLLPLAIALQVAALACVVVAYTKRDDFTVEAAYFNRAIGKPAVAGIFSGTTSGWLIAAAVLLVAAAVAFLLDARARRGASLHASGL